MTQAQNTANSSPDPTNHDMAEQVTIKKVKDAAMSKSPSRSHAPRVHVAASHARGC